MDQRIINQQIKSLEEKLVKYKKELLQWMPLLEQQFEQTGIYTQSLMDAIYFTNKRISELEFQIEMLKTINTPYIILPEYSKRRK